MSSDRVKPGWTRVAFGEIAVSVNDRIDNPLDAGVERYVGLEHLDSGSLTIRRWGSPGDVEATKLRFRKGDIIFGRRRVYQRKVAVADFDGICSAHAMVLRAKSGAVLARFLPFFMQSDVFMERAKEISVGSLSPTINWHTLANEEFALPPLDQQNRLASVLRASARTASLHLDAASAARRLADSLLDRYLVGARELGVHSYHRQFGHYSQQSALVPLGDLVTVAQYGASVPIVSEGQYPILRMTNLREGLTTDVDIGFVNLTDQEYRRYLLRNDDVLLNRTNSHDLVGRTGIHRLSGSFGQVFV